MGGRNTQQQQQSSYPSMMGNGYSYGGGGMMGRGGGMISSSSGSAMMGSGMMNQSFAMMTTQGQPISIQQAIQQTKSIPANARVIPANNTITFSSENVSIFALAIMPDKAVNLTGTQPPSYSNGDVFVIYGLINPTLVIPAGASVHFTIVNLDDDMYHNLVVSTLSPPYPYMAMQGMMTYPQNYQAGGTASSSSQNMMLPFLPPANYSQGSAHEYSYSLTFNQAGSLWYLCTYPGHAQLGMYGRIVVVNG